MFIRRGLEILGVPCRYGGMKYLRVGELEAEVSAVAGVDTQDRQSYRVLPSASGGARAPRGDTITRHTQPIRGPVQPATTCQIYYMYHETLTGPCVKVSDADRRSRSYFTKRL